MYGHVVCFYCFEIDLLAREYKLQPLQPHDLKRYKFQQGMSKTYYEPSSNEPNIFDINRDQNTSLSDSLILLSKLGINAKCGTAAESATLLTTKQKICFHLANLARFNKSLIYTPLKK